jgi:type I restriction enzyme S subunit
MSQPPIEAQSEHWEIIRNILQRHVPGSEVWAFGSRAKWTAKPYSDLDLAIIGQQPLPLAVHAALQDDFSESDLPWKVDIVDWASTSDTFREIIRRDRVVVQEAGDMDEKQPCSRPHVAG